MAYADAFRLGARRRSSPRASTLVRRRAAPGSDEDVARRQLESGRSFARQGNYTEALKDFRAVADTHAATSVADDALLEIARYYLDVAGDHEGSGRRPSIRF